jgi:hypothetical protein
VLPAHLVTTTAARMMQGLATTGPGGISGAVVAAFTWGSARPASAAFKEREGMMRLRTTRFASHLPVIAVVVLILGVVFTGVGLAVRHHRRVTVQTPATAFRMISKQTFFTNEGKAVLRFVFTRLQRGDGSWKNVTDAYNEDGSVRETNQLFGITGRGVFAVNEEQHTLIFKSQKAHAFHQLNEEAMRNDAATYLGEQVILGFRCLGQRDPSDTETYISPSLAFPLKEVITTDKGRIVTEAVKIDLGEPSETEFGEVPNYPLDYSFYEQLIVDTDKRGQHDLANQMRQLEQQSKQQLAKLH